jgi:uncharacterized protein with von Willebrand factor type A (vWA) domain
VYPLPDNKNYGGFDLEIESELKEYVITCVYTQNRKLLRNFKDIKFVTNKKEISPMYVDIDREVLYVEPLNGLFKLLTQKEIGFIMQHELGHLKIAPVSMKLNINNFKKITNVIQDKYLAKLLLEYVYNYTINFVLGLELKGYNDLLTKTKRELLKRENISEIGTVLTMATFPDKQYITNKTAQSIRSVLDDNSILSIPKKVTNIHQIIEEDESLKEQKPRACIVCPFAGACSGECLLSGTRSEDQEQEVAEQQEGGDGESKDEKILEALSTRSVDDEENNEGESNDDDRPKLDPQNPIIQSLTYGEREELRDYMSNPMGGNEAGSFNHNAPPLKMLKILNAMQVLDRVNKTLKEAEMKSTRKYKRGSGSWYDHKRLRDYSELPDIAGPLEMVMLEESGYLYDPLIYDRRQREKRKRVMLVRDTSGSIRGNKALFSENVIIGLVDNLGKKKTRIGYSEFNTDIKTYEIEGDPFTERYGELIIYASNCNNNGGTDIMNALESVIAECNDYEFNIIITSDGEDRELRNALNDPTNPTILEMQEKDVKVFAIFIGGSGKGDLKKLCEKTNGYYYEAVKSDEEEFIEIVDILDHQV